MGVLDDLFDKKPDQPVYHYTSLEGLRGILEQGVIWATHIRYLTDRSEFVHARGCARKFLERRRAETIGDDRAYFSAALDCLDSEERFPNVYVTSFCEERDSLTLWRGYCPPFDGFSLGFDWAKDKSTETVIFKCVYDEKRKNSALSEIAGIVATRTPELVKDWLAERGAPLNTSSDFHVLGSAFVHWLEFFAPTMKDQAFADEKEWRVMWRPASEHKPKYRRGRRLMVPYAEIPLHREGLLQIDEVVVGPCEEMNETLMATEGWIASLDDPDRHVRTKCKGCSPSRVPFRPV